ncbi:chloride channel protein [Dellaglioa sp. L3N]
MKFDSMFIFMSSLLGLFVGIVASLFLVILNMFVHFIWVTIPGNLEWSYYPLAVGLIGGLLVGLFQKHLGDYPKTMHQTLREFKETGSVQYKKRVGKNILSAWIVLAFGASLGPEAALSSILGGLISWVGDKMKLTLKRREEFLNLGIGTMMATIFHAPLLGIGEAIEEDASAKKATGENWAKIILYGWTTLLGILGFTSVNRLFPKEALFGLHFAKVNWQLEALWLILPALVIGVIFGIIFLKIEDISERIAKKITNKVLAAILAGALIGISGMISPYLLFSGEHQLLSFSGSAAKESVLFLILLALGKALLTNICFAFGWRGGKIFPAVFASVAIGFSIITIFNYTPGLVIGIVVAASVTTILNQPIVTGALLLFLFPIQFFPMIAVACYLSGKVRNKLEKIKIIG